MFIKQMRAKGHRLNIILKAIGLPRRTYYHWRNYQPSKREIENTLDRVLTNLA